jgi:hypothetical protein
MTDKRSPKVQAGAMGMFASAPIAFDGSLAIFARNVAPTRTVKSRDGPLVKKDPEGSLKCALKTASSRSRARLELLRRRRGPVNPLELLDRPAARPRPTIRPSRSDGGCPIATCPSPNFFQRTESDPPRPGVNFVFGQEGPPNQACLAGPPFFTDDPVPVDLGHWEINNLFGIYPTWTAAK